MQQHPQSAAAWHRDYDRVAQAITWLVAHREERPEVGDLAAALHLSPRQLQRSFGRFAGTSPHRFLRWLTASAARELLRQRATVLSATLASSVSSPGRLHDLLVTVDGVTPGELARDGAGLTLGYGTHPTPLGPALIATSRRGVVALRFLDDPEADHARAALQVEWPAAELVEDRAGTAVVARSLVAVLHGEHGGPTLPVAPLGTNLQLKVWEALLRIPAGAVTSYGQLAASMGHPRAVRAVASAVGRNPVAVLIPCHRVLRSTGELGGYRWGPVRKQALLALEAARHDTAGEESGQ